MDGQQALTAADGTDTTSGLSAGEHNGEQLESQNNRQKQGDKARNIKAQGPLICVVPGCTVDVSAGPHYLKRHKICQEHLKARSVVIDGQEVRFCQQCGRFQTLAEFKDDRRSCEAALAAHNARRRVKKDNNPWGTNRRRSNKRALLSTGTDDPSSSEDGAVGASRKVAPRKSSSQRSAPSALQSAAGSDSFRGQGSDGAERPNLSDGARTVEQGQVWVSNTSPGNSFGSPEGLEQQQPQLSQLQLQLQALQQVQQMSALCTVGSSGDSPITDCEDQQLQQLHALRQQLLPDAGYQQQQAGLATQHVQPAGQAGMWPSTASKLASGRSRLGRSSGSGLGSNVPACCEAPSALTQQQMIQDTLLHSAGMPAANPLQQAMLDPSVAVGPSIYGQPGSLAAWMVPPSIAQQQQAQLQQYLAPLGGVGMEEAMGQSLMLQQAMQEQQQQLMLSQAQMHQQMPIQIQLQQQAATQQQMLVQQQQQVLLQQQPPAQQQQQHSMLMGSVQSSRGSGTDAGSLSSSVLALGQDMLGSAAGAAAADDMVVGTAAAPPAGLPATSAGAAAALASQPVCGTAPLHGCASSTSLGLFDSIDQATAGAGPQSADGDDDALLDQALDILLSSGVDWQLDDVLLGTGQDGSVAFSGFTPAPAPTSSPSSSNVNGGNLSGPLSVPSQPSATSVGMMPAAAQQAACPLTASAAAGLAGATDALRIGSPGKVGSSMPAVVAPAVQGSMLVAGGLPPACMLPVLDMPMPQVADMGTLPGQAGPAGYQFAPPVSMNGSFSTAMGCIAYPVSDVSNCGLSVTAGGGAAAFLGSGQPAGGNMHATGLTGMSAGVPAAPVMGTCGSMVATAAMVQPPSSLGGLHAPGFTKMDSSVTGMLGISPQQQLWQQPQQPQESLLLQQQLTMQQQQQAEYALLQQQQQRQRHEQLMHMQQQIESQRRNSQQLVRLSIKLHGVTPEQLPQHTVQAMERLLTNNAADMETILLQPSLRQGCIQFELDVLVQCPRQQESLAAVHAERDTAGTAMPGDRPERSSSEIKAQQQLGAATSAAIVGAINTCRATAAAEACLRRALPFKRLVSALLELPLLPSAPAAAAAAADGDSDADAAVPSSSSGVQEPSSSPAAAVHSLATAIYAQIGDHLGIWRADCGLVQDWADQLPQQFVCSPDSSIVGQGLLRPQFQACMPLATATAESSTASSPMAAGLAHMLRPLHLRAVVQPAASSGSDSSADCLPVQLWCTRLGQFLPVVVRAAAAAAPAGAGQHAAGQQLDLQVVTGLQDASPGLLLLQVEQQIGRHNSDDNGSSDSSTGSSGSPRDEAAVLKCMSGLIPVLLCPSAAMAAEVNAHLLVANDRSSTSQRLLQLGLLLDFWAIQSLQHQHLAAAPLVEWYDGLLQNPRYLKIVKTVGTQLLLYAVINGMSATAAHLMTIMAVVRSLVSTAAAPVAEGDAAAATAAAAAGAGVTDADAELAAEAEPSNTSSSQRELEASNAAAAAGSRRVQDWVFEDVDCKSSTSGSSSSSMPDSSGSREADSTGGKALRKSGSGAHAAAAAAEARVPETDNQQSPLAMFRGAAQVLAMLVAMYLALEVSAAVYKGYSPAKQLLSSLLHLQQLASVMLVPLVMMCLGAVLAVWQFGLGTRRRPQAQQQEVQQHQGQPGAARAAEGKAAMTAARATAAAGGQ